jgi:hypothetical protein
MGVFDVSKLSKEDREAYESELERLNRTYNQKLVIAKTEEIKEQASSKECLSAMRKYPLYKSLKAKYNDLRKKRVKYCHSLDEKDPILRNFVISYEIFYGGVGFGFELDNVKIFLNKEVYGKKEVLDETPISWFLSQLRDSFDTYNDYWRSVCEIDKKTELISQEINSIFYLYDTLCKKYNVVSDYADGLCLIDMEDEFELE